VIKKLVCGLGLLTVFAVGAIQFVQDAKAQDHPLCPCVACPPGYVLSPTPGNCCRCVKAH